jgi:lipopolysaccharide export system permease protein
VNKLSVLLLRSYIGPFIVTFLVAMFIFEMQFIWVYLDELLGKGLGPWVVFKLMIYASMRLVNMALPLAILMSSIMTMGALAENNELTAMKSAGISLMRIMRPLVFFSIGISITAFVFANNIWPVSNLKFRILMYGIIRQKPELNLSDGVFYNGIEGVSIRVGRNNRETGELTDVLIYDHRGGEKANRTVIRAASGSMEQTADKRFMILKLSDGISYDEQRDKKTRDPQYTLIEGKFEEMDLRIDLSSLAFTVDNEEVMKNVAEMLSVRQLDIAIDSLGSLIDTVRQQYAESTLVLARKRLEKKQEPTFNVDEELYASSNEQNRHRALAWAIENTRKSKEMVKRQSEELMSRQKNFNRHKIEWHRKFFLAVVCLVLFFIGAPLGAIIRKGGIGLPTLIALSLFILYHLLTMTGERMAKKQLIEPWIGMWMSTVVLFPLSIWITVKAMRESAITRRADAPGRFVRFFRRFTNRKSQLGS